MVWSPLSNLLLYGGTADVAAAHAAGVPIALGSDWSPSGSRNLLAELKVARVVNASLSPAPFTDRDLVAMATRDAAAMLGWGDALGSIGDGSWPTCWSSPGRAATRTTTCCAPRMGTSLSSSSMASLASDDRT